MQYKAPPFIKNAFNITLTSFIARIQENEREKEIKMDRTWKNTSSVLLTNFKEQKHVYWHGWDWKPWIASNTRCRKWNNDWATCQVMIKLKAYMTRYSMIWESFFSSSNVKVNLSYWRLRLMNTWRLTFYSICFQPPQAIAWNHFNYKSEIAA